MHFSETPDEALHARRHCRCSAVQRAKNNLHLASPHESIFHFFFLYFRGLAMPLYHKTFKAPPVQINKATAAFRKGRVRSARCTRPRCLQSRPSRRRPRSARTPPSGCRGEERERREAWHTSHTIPALGLEERICMKARNKSSTHALCNKGTISLSRSWRKHLFLGFCFVIQMHPAWRCNCTSPAAEGWGLLLGQLFSSSEEQRRGLSS